MKASFWGGGSKRRTLSGHAGIGEGEDDIKAGLILGSKIKRSQEKTCIGKVTRETSQDFSLCPMPGA